MDTTFGPPLAAYPVTGHPATTAALHSGGLRLTVPGGAVEVAFAFPQLGRPHFPAGGTGAPAELLPATCLPTRVTGTVADPDGLVRAALAGRIALLATGDPSTVVPLEVGAAVALPGEGTGHPLVGMPPERRLLDVAVAVDAPAGGAGTPGWRVVAPHAVYARTQWADFGIAHITDTHVARRIDSFRPTLRGLGRDEAAAKMINWNDRFRGFVRFANALHDAGELDLIVATGDIIDYQFEASDDPLGGGNALFMRQLILGQAPGPDFPVVEELRVPILLTPGNHDYRVNPYHLIFDVNELGLDWHRFHNYYGYHMLKDDALALTTALSFPDSTGVPNLDQSEAAAMVAVEASMRSFREHLADPATHVVHLGPHRIVMIDSSHDVGKVTSMWDGFRTWLGTLSADEATFVGGSPNCEGVSDEEYDLAVATLEQAPDEGLVVMALHAPLVNLWDTELPYYLRETQRPADPGQAWWYAARHTDPLRSLEPDWVRGKHREWFGRDGEGEPAYLKRGDSQDLLDFGVSRGRTDDLLRAIAGEGTRRRADVVLAGHTHYHNEIRLGLLPEGGLGYYLDFYTGNPRQYYRARFLTPADVKASALSGRSPGGFGATLPLYEVRSSRTYVHIDEEALPFVDPWPMPYAASSDHVVQVPPYADPLDRTADPRAWWDRHKPLLLQTGALGPMEDNQVSFSGLRLLTVRANVIERIHTIGMERLEAAGFVLPLAAAAAVDGPRGIRHRERSRRFDAPPIASAPMALAHPAGHSLVYRDDEGYLVELWDTTGSAGSGRLADRDLAPAATGRPSGFMAPDGTAVVLYRGGDGHIHSLSWSGSAAVGHDALSATAQAVAAAGDPIGYVHADTTHVFYRSADGHIEELWWVGIGEIGHGHITGYCDEPLAAGDPGAYVVSTTGQNIVVYRGVDGHIHSLYWSDGPTGHDNLSGYVGTPLAAGEPTGYHTPHNDAHQVVYRGVDGHLHEIWWVGVAAASGWDLIAASGSPAAAADPVAWFVPETGVKHVAYVGVDGHVHDLAWAPGAPAPTWVDLTIEALAPPAAAERVSVAVVPGSPVCRVAYRGTDRHVHEIRWG